MNIAVILSGGIGTRVGLDIPKQYVAINNQPVISYCLKTLLENEQTDAVVIVVSKEWKKFVSECAEQFHSKKPIYYRTR